MQTPSARLNDITLARNIPVFVTIELTRRCPLSCRHCYLPETRGRAKPGRELGTVQWKKVISSLARAGGLYLVFTGGEPLLRADLPELCAYASARGFSVRVFSTGLPLDAVMAGRLAAAGLAAFEISFYGPPAAHDKVTGLRGSFERSLAAARLLKRTGVAVRMKTPLMRGNLRWAGWLRELAGREGFSISFDPVLAPANDGDGAPLRLRLPAAGLAAALRLDPPSRRRVQSVPPSAGADLVCGAGRNVCSVAPDGTLSPCLQLPVKLGSLAARPFGKIWKGSAWLKKWRRTGAGDLPVCSGCKDKDFCARCPGISLLERGDVLAPNSQACAMAAAMRRLHGPR